MAEPILGRKVLKEFISKKKWNEKKLECDQKVFQKWSNALNGKWANVKETELTSPFYDQVLLNILGYTEGPSKEYTIGFENRTKSSAQKPDVILGGFSETNHSQPEALIEFESPYTPLDAHNVGVEQAFSYQSQYSQSVRWIIASNFRETRLYDSTREHVEVFKIEKLAKSMDEIKKFIFFLSANSIVKSLNKQGETLELAVANNVADQKKISDKFYSDYLQTRNKLLDNIKTNNPTIPTKKVFTYAQKILDRFIFIAFAQDYKLIPQNTFKNVLNTPKGSFERYPIWAQMKGLFNAIDKGWPEKSINRFNGGLFKTDAELDNLSVTNDIFKSFEVIDNYDFKTDLSVNLLGHIFEQAINDIDAAKSNTDYSSKRKKDGIFYTPSEITSFLLTETLQSWINDAYKELNLNKKNNFTERDYKEFRDSYMSSSSTKRPTKKARSVSDYIIKLEKLADKIKSIKIIDPAVGSGSFLTQALENLKTLLDQINNTIESITLQPSFPTNDTDILSNNLFGVDINKESVEIAKLSLWLRTANNKKPLTTLDNNLKVGNSIIDDIQIASNAFIWGQEFKEVFIKNRGFDIVLGNPPYVFSSENMTEKEKKYYSNHYAMSEYQENLYRVFTEKGFNLLKPGGWLGFIIPKTWFTNDYFGKMRSFLMKETTNLKIIDVQDRVFEDANVDTSLVIFKKPFANTPASTTTTVGIWKDNKIQFEQQRKIDSNIQAPIAINQTNKILENIEKKILEHSDNGQDNIGSNLKITDGIKLFERGKGIPKQPIEKENFTNFKTNNNFFNTIQLRDDYYPFYDGKKLHRYQLLNTEKYLHYGKHLAAPRKLENFSGKHIIIRRIPNKGKYILISTIVDGNSIHLHEQSIWDAHSKNEKYPLEFMLGILNSSITSYWLIMKLGVLSRSTFPQLRSSAIKGIPVIKVSKKRQNIIVKKVSQIIKLENRKSEIIYSYQKSLNIINSTKAPAFDSLIQDTSRINAWLKKNVPVRRLVETFNYVNDLIQEFKVHSDKTSQLSKDIDMQLYSTLSLTNREIQEMDDVFKQISKK